ncbi:hypothetical protein GCM10009557_39550 [Virgisporangium ochraceum]|uniref:Uncharacterized protein n=1 Tax=Virgisporangium ochraceum TaxID=65505 RepID=A0A8J3ZXB1_9ACTN|nr:hypothetical protein Voc01_067390 [Virgisporangium ochraceum]
MPSWNWWKCTSWSCVAEYTFTGTDTNPKLTTPVQIERAMHPYYPAAPPATTGSCSSVRHVSGSPRPYTWYTSRKYPSDR